MAGDMLITVLTATGAAFAASRALHNSAVSGFALCAWTSAAPRDTARDAGTARAAGVAGVYSVVYAMLALAGAACAGYLAARL